MKECYNRNYLAVKWILSSCEKSSLVQLRFLEIQVFSSPEAKEVVENIGSYTSTHSAYPTQTNTNMVIKIMMMTRFIYNNNNNKNNIYRGYHQANTKLIRVVLYLQKYNLLYWVKTKA